MAVVVALCVLGGGFVYATMDDDDPKPGPSSSATASSTQNSSPSASGSASNGGNVASGLGDICPKLDLAPLGDWAKTKDSSNTSQSKTTYAERSSCYLTLRGPGREMSSLDVTAKLFESADEAKDDLDSSRKYGAKDTFDGEITGVGESAFGAYEEKDLGGKVISYEVETRSGNLVISVRLVRFSTNSQGNTNKEEIKGKAVAQAKSAITALTKR